MHISRPGQPRGNGEILPPSSWQDRVDELLKGQLDYFPNKELSPAEIEHWYSDLKGYSLKAIEWAFDCHRRCGRFFPLPVDILTLLADWEPTPDWFGYELPRGREQLRDEWPVVLALFNKVSERVRGFQERKENYVPLSTAEANDLLAQAKAHVHNSEQKGEAVRKSGGIA